MAALDTAAALPIRRRRIQADRRGCSVAAARNADDYSPQSPPDARGFLSWTICRARAGPRPPTRQHRIAFRPYLKRTQDHEQRIPRCSFQTKKRETKG